VALPQDAPLLVLRGWFCWRKRTNLVRNRPWSCSELWSVS